jgi:hypothetical protein
MRWLEVRRHSLTKKGTARGRGSHLSAEGVALACLVGESLGPFASVVSSVSPRAIETALAMGPGVDDTMALPSGYVPGEVDHHEQWRWPHPYRTYAVLLGRGGGLTTGAEAHRRLDECPGGGARRGRGAGRRPRRGGRAGGGGRLAGCRPRAVGCRWVTVTASVSALTRAGSSLSSSPGCRRSCCPGAPRSAGGKRRSFLSLDWRNDRPPRRPRAPKEFVQLPGLAAPRHRGETAAMIDPMTPTEAGWHSPGVVGIGTASFLARPATRCFPTCDRRRVS